MKTIGKARIRNDVMKIKVHKDILNHFIRNDFYRSNFQEAIDQPLQAGKWQSSVWYQSVNCFGHCIPFSEGAGSVQNLILVRTDSPHSLSHLPHWPQADHWPSTEMQWKSHLSKKK